MKCPVCGEPSPGRRTYCTDAHQAEAKRQRRTERGSVTFRSLWPACGDLGYAAAQSKLTLAEAGGLAHAIVITEEQV